MFKRILVLQKASVTWRDFSAIEAPGYRWHRLTGGDALQQCAAAD